MPKWHVVTDGWRIEPENGEESEGHFSTQEHAIAAAKEIARVKGGGEIVVHSEDGEIEESLVIGQGSASDDEPAQVD